MTASATANAIDLTPDATTFGKGTGPWYLDPTVSANGATMYATQVQEYNPGTAYGNMSGSLGTGYCGYFTGPDPCPNGGGRERAYFQIGIPAAIYTVPSGALNTPTLYTATLNAQVTGLANTSATIPLGLYHIEGDTGTSSGVGSWTSWNNQPGCANGHPMSNCPEVSKFTVTGTGGVAYDVLGYINTLAQCRCTSWTVALEPEDENNRDYRVHLANNPSITINYDINPTIWYPRTTPQPGFSSNPNLNNDCQTPGTTHPWDNPGWVGANQNIYLTASNWSPTGMSLHTVFRLWDDNNTSWGWTGDSGWGGNYNTGQSVAVGSLTDGHQYGWTANAADANPTSNGLVSADSSWCYFRVDKTPPTVSISSTDFPPSGTPNPNPAKHAGEQGTFTLTGTDPAPAGGAASGVACFRVSTDPTPVTGWKCTDGTANGIVLPSTPTFTYTPGAWGTNIVYAQAQDNAGNYSQPAAYSFYAPWNPTYSAVFGDVTGDGKPDIVLPDASGNLHLISATTDPTNALSARATLSPNGRTWNGVQISHRGSLSPNITVDDLIAHSSGGVDVYLYPNDGHGVYNTPSTLGGMPHDCRDAAGTPLIAGCPTGFIDTNDDWANATQVISLGTPEGENNTPTSVSRTSLIAVVNKQLWLFHGAPQSDTSHYLDQTARLLSTADWSNFELIAPGPAFGGNQPSLWARNKSDGTIHAYQITGGATPDYTKLADPTAGTMAGINLPAASYPTVGSSGDLNGDHIPDLWATTLTGKLAVFTGIGDSTGKVTGFNTPSSPTNLTDLRSPLGRWKLTGADSTGTKTADSLGQDNVAILGTHPATLHNVTFTSDNPTGTSPTTVATFNGTTSSETDTAAPIVDTTKSFTISLWVKPAAGSSNTVVVSQNGTNTSGFMLFPGPDNTWHFGMATADDMTWPYEEVYAQSSADQVQFGVWSQLKVSFNSTTGQMDLFVNGTLAATGHHSKTLAFNGPLALGRYQNAGQSPSQSFFTGSISDLTVYNYPTTPAAITSAAAPTKCVDDNGNSGTDGTAIQIFDCNHGPSQQWIAADDGTLQVNGKCLDSSGGATVLESCNGTPSQQFTPRADGTIYSGQTGLCADDPGWVTTNGTQLDLYACNGGANQKWNFTTP